MISKERFEEIESAAHCAIWLADPERYVVEYIMDCKATPEEVATLRTCISYLNMRKHQNLLGYVKSDHQVFPNITALNPKNNS